MSEGQTKLQRFSNLTDVEADSMSNYSPISELRNFENEDCPPSYGTAQRQEQERIDRLSRDLPPETGNESSENVTITHEHNSGKKTSLVMSRPNQNFQVIISDGGTVNVDNRNYGSELPSPKQVELNVPKPEITDSDEMISDGMVQYVASHLGAHWKAVGRRLGVSTADIEYITADNQSECERAYYTVRKWYESMGKKASYKILAKALVDTHSKLYDLASNVSPDGIEV